MCSRVRSRGAHAALTAYAFESAATADGRGGYSEYSRRYLLLMLLMFYGTLMFALEYARSAIVATFVILLQPSATLRVAPTADVVAILG